MNWYHHMILQKNSVINVEEKSQEELKELAKEYTELAEQAAAND